MPVPAVEFPHFLPVEGALLAPPYDTLRPLPSTSQRDSAPPLGTIAHASGRQVLGALASLTAIAHQFSWVALCISVAPDDASLEPCIELVSELRHRLAVVHGQGPMRRVRTSAIVDAVRRRPPPRPVAMAEYVSHRLGRPELWEPLATQFSEALEGIPATANASVATYSRLFARYGRFSARHWRALARLTRMLATRSPGALDPHDAGSRSLVHYRTAVRHTRKFLDLSLSVATRWVGWEWVIERALRVGGYIAAR